MKGNAEQNSRIPNIVSIYCPNPDVSFSLITFCLCTSPETPAKLDHYPGGDHRMSYKEN